MARYCSKCNSEMVEDCVCKYLDKGSPLIKYPTTISVQKGSSGLFKTGGIDAELKVAICPNCGTVEFYVENSKQFEKFLENKEQK